MYLISFFYIRIVLHSFCLFQLKTESTLSLFLSHLFEHLAIVIIKFKYTDK